MMRAPTEVRTVVRAFGEDRRLTIVRLRRNVALIGSRTGRKARSTRRDDRLHDADDVSHPERLRAQKRWMQDTAQHISGTCVHHFMPLRSRPRRYAGAFEMTDSCTPSPSIPR